MEFPWSRRTSVNSQTNKHRHNEFKMHSDATVTNTFLLHTDISQQGKLCWKSACELIVIQEKKEQR